MANDKRYEVNGKLTRLNHAPSIKGALCTLMIENSTAIFSVNYSGVVERDGVGVLDLVASNIGDQVSFSCIEVTLPSGRNSHSIVMESFRNNTISCKHEDLLQAVG